jgi:putative endopeptidase
MAANKRTSGNKKKASKTKNDEVGFSVSNMDLKVDPLKDFYNYANGTWLKKHKIPDDKVAFGSFNQLYEMNQASLREILESSSKKTKRNPIEAMCGDFYSSFMDTRTIEKVKLSPVQPYLQIAKQIKNLKDVAKVSAELDKIGIQNFLGGSNSFLPRKSMPDKKDSSVYAFYMNQGGLSLPDRNYYLDKKFEKVLTEYALHLEKMFRLFGYSRKDAVAAKESVLSIEKELAAVSRSRADLRDQEKNYNRVPVKDLAKKYKNFDFLLYLKTLKVPSVDYVIVGQPEFLQRLDKLLKEVELSSLSHYLEWKVMNYFAPYLNEEVVAENFRFFRKTLVGQAEMEPRWKRAVTLIDGTIGEAVGSLYAEKYFTAETRKRMEIMLEDIKDVFRERLENLPWMTKETKKRALQKFSKFRAKVGHPEKFRDYRSVSIDRKKLIDNIVNASSFEMKRQISRVGKKVDRKEWMMTPPTVNAYFNPSGNEIVFPAGIIQPPFFNPDLDDAVNYGAIGGVIAHEITHGFDDQGRQYDEDGNLKNWWGKSDLKKFDEASDSVVKLYGSKESVPGFKVDGKLTLGENIADLGAIRIAFEALERHLKRNPKLNKKIDGFTPEQRFFISWANIWRGLIREEEAKRRVTIDPHAPNHLRGSLPPMNHPKFEETFGGKKSKVEKVGVW